MFVYIYFFFKNVRYDGQRAQIHRSMDGSIRVFSRNGDETTPRFPDLVASIKEACKPSTSTFVLDAEVMQNQNFMIIYIYNICSFLFHGVR